MKTLDICFFSASGAKFINKFSKIRVLACVACCCDYWCDVCRCPYKTQNDKMYENITKYSLLFHNGTVYISPGASRSEVRFKLLFPAPM